MRPILLAMLVITPLAGAAGSVPDPCLRERAWLAAEATTPGVLQRLMREALEACLARQPARAGGSAAARPTAYPQR